MGSERQSPRVIMRKLIPASVLLVAGTQTIFSGFFLRILRLQRVGDADLAHAPK